MTSEKNTTADCRAPQGLAKADGFHAFH